METDTNKDKELKEIAPILASIPKEVPFTVPASYFDNLSDIISKNVIATELAAIPKENPFAVPANYFEELPEMIAMNIAATRLEGIPKENPFDVPANYFERLNSEIQDKVIASKKKEGFDWIGLLLKPKFSLSLITIAVALVIIFKFSANHGINNDKFAFSMKEIVNSGELNDIDESTIIETLSANNKTNSAPKQGEIEKYLLDNNVDESQITGQL
jgi:hypothetical protein